MRLVVEQAGGLVTKEDVVSLALGMVLLGVATFVALIGFIELCDRV